MSLISFLVLKYFLLFYLIFTVIVSDINYLDSQVSFLPISYIFRNY